MRTGTQGQSQREQYQGHSAKAVRDLQMLTAASHLQQQESPKAQQLDAETIWLLVAGGMVGTVVATAALVWIYWHWLPATLADAGV